MKLSIRRTYCPVCKKTVRGKEAKEGHKINITCGRCGRLLYVHDGVEIRFIKNAD